MNIGDDAESLKSFITNIEKDLSKNGKYYLKKILGNIELLESLQKDMADIKDLNHQEVISNCDANTFDLINFQNDLINAFGLINKTQGIYIEYLLGVINDIDQLSDIAQKANDEYHELDLKIQVHESIKNTEKQIKSEKSKFAANKKHERTNLAKQSIREIWSTGKYSSRDICAEQECASLALSYSTARKALINTPDPA